MIRLIVIVLIVAGAWMAWWAIGRTAHEAGINAWLEARRAEGLAAEVARVDVRGFPSRLDTTLTDVTLANPATGVIWSAPFVQFLSLAYKPHQVIAVLPEQHSLTTPEQSVTISHGSARGSLFFQPRPSLPLERTTFVIDGLSLKSNLGWEISADEVRLAAERQDASAPRYRIGAEMLSIALSRSVVFALDRGGILPDQIEALRLDAVVTFNRPWDRHALEDEFPQPSGIDLSDVSLTWGEIALRGSGEIALDGSGVPEGAITLRADEWRRVLDLSVSAGLLSADVGDAVETGLSLLALSSGNGQALQVDLSFRSGATFLGPVPLGPAPRIVLQRQTR